jgi:hypothetical protein
MIKPFNSDPFAFYCYVEEEGYEWVRGRLVGCGETGYVLPKTMPSGLFLEFARLEQEPEAIRRFACEYGIIAAGGPEALVANKGRFHSGSTVAEWAAEIADMGEVTRIWQAIEDPKRRAELKEIITRVNGAIRCSISTPKQVWNYAWREADSYRFGKKDLLLPAKYVLQAEINRRLADPQNVTAPRLVWTRDHSAKERSQRLVFTPPNLLAALWLQFAQALTGDCQLKECEGCGKYFLRGPGANRRDGAKTCRDACRQRKRWLKKKQKSLR